MTDRIILSFNSRDPLEIQLALDYWAVNEDGDFLYSVNAIMARTGLKRNRILEIVREAAAAFYPNIRCQSCGDPLELKTRSAFQGRYRLSPAFECEVCTARAQAAERCLEREKERAEHERMNRILIGLKTQQAPFDYSKINYFDAAIACSIMIQSESAIENGYVGNPANVFLCSGNALLSDLLGVLHRHGILLFGEATDISSLSSESEEFGTYTYFPLRVKWKFAEPLGGGSFSATFRLLNSIIDEREKQESYYETVRDLWWRLARDDAEHYLRKQLELYGLFDFTVGPKMSEAFEYALQRFSVPKLRYLLYRIAKNTAALSTRREFTKRHALNTIPGALIRDCDRALADGWQINGYTLKWDTEEASLFTFLFDRLIGSGIAGFRLTSGRYLDQTIEEGSRSSRGVVAGSNLVQ